MLEEIMLLILLFTRSNNLEKHKRTCTGCQVAVPVAAPAAKNVTLVLLLSLNYERLVNHLEVL